MQKKALPQMPTELQMHFLIRKQSDKQQERIPIP